MLKKPGNNQEHQPNDNIPMPKNLKWAADLEEKLVKTNERGRGDINAIADNKSSLNEWDS